MLPLVLIIGRANVGKSALFNAMVGQRQALISKIPGTTRDVNFADLLWKNSSFTLGDSGGLENLQKITRYPLRVTRYAGAPLEHLIELKTLEHLQKASLLILVVDADTGMMPQDRQIMRFLHSRGLSFILAVNKVDGKKDEPKAEEFLRLNITPTFLISSVTRKGVGDLLDYISSKLPTTDYQLSTKKTIRVAIIGRTNVGKSTLTNALIGLEEMIVSATPHTTREPHAKQIPLDENYQIELIDTAGIRKKAKIEHFLEIAGVRMSLERLKQADVVLFVIDVSENLTSQDLALARLIAEHRRSCIIVGNKWDIVSQQSTVNSQQNKSSLTRSIRQQSSHVIPNLIWNPERENKKQKDPRVPSFESQVSSFEKYIRKALSKLSYAPVVFVSAKDGENTQSLKPLIKQIYENTYRTFSEHDTNVILQRSLKLQPPPIVGEKKRKVQIRGLYQNSKNPKEYILKVFTRDYVPLNFVKFIEKRLRASLPLNGVPMYITVENTQSKNR